MADDTTAKDIDAKDTERGVYELGYHIVPTIGEEQVPKEVTALKELIEKRGGAVISEEFPHFVTLAYTMVRSRGGKREKYTTTHFGWIKFEMETASAADLKEKLGTHEPVLRFVLFKTVREDTRAPKRITEQKPKPSEPIRPKLTTAPKTKEPAEKVSDEDLDRTIEELVVE